MYRDPMVATGAAGTTTGKAITCCRGAIASSGRFSVRQADAITANWVWLGLHRRGKMGSRASMPTACRKTRQCLLRLSQCEIMDTWHTTGLRGTGSNDVVVHDEFCRKESATFQLSGTQS